MTDLFIEDVHHLNGLAAVRYQIHTEKYPHMQAWRPCRMRGGESLLCVNSEARYLLGAMKWRWRILALVGGIVVVVAMFMLFWQEKPTVTMSVLAVWKEKDGQWWTTLLLSNELNAPVAFEFVESEDRDLKDDGRKRLVPYDSYPSELSPHEAVNFALRLPPPGTVRRFRMHCSKAQEETRIHRWLRSFGLAGEWRAPTVLAVSPEVSAADAQKYPVSK